MAALDRCTTGVLAVAYELGRCAAARTTVMRERPVRRRPCGPPGAGCGDWRSLIAMTLPYRGSLTLFPFDSEEELAKNVDFWRLMLCAWGFIEINCRENSREGSP